MTCQIMFPPSPIHLTGVDPGEDYENELLMMSRKARSSHAPGHGVFTLTGPAAAATEGVKEHLLEARRVLPCIMVRRAPLDTSLC